MNKKEFLEGSDMNILDYCVSETVCQDGTHGIDVILTIGKTEKEMEEWVMSMSEGEFAESSIVHFDEYEICLTKDELKHLISAIEYAEENGVDYDSQDY